MTRERTYYSARTPGSLGGDKPKRYGTGRRCRCGTVISPYTKGEWCNLCSGSKPRRDHFLEHPKETIMEPETMKAKQAADYLGVTAKGLKDLERAGRIKAHKSGRGLFGSTFVLVEVCELKAKLDREAEAEKAVLDTAVPPNGKRLTETLAQGGIVRPGAFVDFPDHVTPIPPASDEDNASAREEGQTIAFDETPLPCPATGEAECPDASGTCCRSEVRTPCDDDPESCKNGEGCGEPGTCPYEHVGAEPGYPDPRDYAANDEGAAQYEQAVKDFEGSTRLETVEEVKCCGRSEICGTGACIEDGPADEPEQVPVLERAIAAAERAVHSLEKQSELTQQAIDVAARAVQRVVNLDREAVAIDAIAKALGGLSHDERVRVLRWSVERFDAGPK